MTREPDYWFPAKRYGWGWGLPSRWQGWVVFIGYFLLLGLGVFFLPPERRPLAFLAYASVLSFALVGVAWLKGEPPRWRWGK